MIQGVLCGLEGLVFGEVKSQVHCKASVVATGEIETHHQYCTCEEIGDDKKKKKVVVEMQEMNQTRAIEHGHDGIGKLGLGNTERHEAQHHVVPCHFCTRTSVQNMQVHQPPIPNPDHKLQSPNPQHQIPKPKAPNPNPQTCKLEVNPRLLLPPPIVINSARTQHRHVGKHAHQKRQICYDFIDLGVGVEADGVARCVEQPALRELAPLLHLLEFLEDGFGFFRAEFLVRQNPERGLAGDCNASLLGGSAVVAGSREHGAHVGCLSGRSLEE